MPAPRTAAPSLTAFQQGRLAAFDNLPADAIVDDAVAAVILGVSIQTLKRHDPVPRRQISERVIGRRVGDIRDKVRGVVNGKGGVVSEAVA
jgi:hypothetical protein